MRHDKEEQTYQVYICVKCGNSGGTMIRVSKIDESKGYMHKPGTCPSRQKLKLVPVEQSELDHMKEQSRGQDR